MHQYKKTKIVATIGPATETPEMLEKLLSAGMNVMRLNFSHGDYAEHQKKLDTFRNITKNKDLSYAILQDLAGPKIRIGDFETESIVLKEKATFTLTTEKIIGNEKRAYVNYPTLHEEVKKGQHILLDDGRRRLEVIRITATDIVCKVLMGGMIRGRRGVNVPGAYLKVSSLTAKDKKDLVFGLKNNVEYIALSFVRRPEDIQELRKILVRNKSEAKIIAKIETQEAIDNLDAIIAATDGVMVARGDLAIEVPTQKVPLLQKQMITKCNKLGKPVIVATQMLESMVRNAVPTRAEVSDIANAILDGADAVMLSEETTYGEHPVEAVNVMSRVAHEVESLYPERIAYAEGEKGKKHGTDVVTTAIVNTAHDAGAKAIIAITQKGGSARMIARHRSTVRLITLSPNKYTCNQLALSFGCYAFQIPQLKNISDITELVRKFCVEHKIARKGDKVVIAAGLPFNKPEVGTNLMVVETI